MDDGGRPRVAPATLVRPYIPAMISVPGALRSEDALRFLGAAHQPRRLVPFLEHARASASRGTCAAVSKTRIAVPRAKRSFASPDVLDCTRSGVVDIDSYEKAA